MNCISMDSITEMFYHLYLSALEVCSRQGAIHIRVYLYLCHLNKMLIATKHIADNNFVFQ